jgi:hypothetical protein
MAGLGVRGKLEWIYRSYKGMPYNSFDAEPIRSQLVLPGPEGSVIHSLEYQRMKMGFDDLTYLFTLEQLLASRKKSGDSTPEITSAEVFLHRLEGLIEDDMNHYLDGDTKRWTAARYDALRNETIDHILQLRP